MYASHMHVHGRQLHVLSNCQWIEEQDVFVLLLSIKQLIHSK